MSSRDPRLLAQVELAEESEVAIPESPSPARKNKLDRRTKAELIFVLASILGAGFVLIAFTWLAARLTRRYMRPLEKMPPRPLDPVFTDDWAARPLTPQERTKLDSEEW